MPPRSLGVGVLPLGSSPLRPVHTGASTRICVGRPVHPPPPWVTESYPGATYKRISNPEELSDPDIQDATVTIKEKEKPEWVCPNTSEEEPCGKTERRTARGAEERTESREANAGENANDGRSDPKTVGGLEKGQKTPTETPRRTEQRRHVPGGAWLTQVRSYLRFKFLPEWIRGGSERE
ncbi:hypothetical protein NDU88_006467 [Pleurodeles waltl]|uniref:Uncharacterized protein n=1 Tax=Pleurodeles waltl TaxID=8319 RepID=A0AAV7PIT3_PLEWA|nr:hypothetical protein NDU88_006467 [Pleurodeles waltl]